MKKKQNKLIATWVLSFAAICEIGKVRNEGNENCKPVFPCSGS